MIDTIATPGEFTQRWMDPPNFYLAPHLRPFRFTLPRALEILDVIRNDDEVRFTLLGDLDPGIRSTRTRAFRQAPVEEVAQWPFRLVHFHLARFYDDLLAGFQEEVMIPWRTFLSAHGFTWQRCSPLLFLSGPGGHSTYHTDQSHGLVWQIEGAKTFHSYYAPEEVMSAAAAIRCESTGEHPPLHDARTVQAVRMGPGDLLWSHVLTPHWVTGDTTLSMSVNLSHGGLARQGRFAQREQVLRDHWDKHPDEPWLTDLRNARY